MCPKSAHYTQKWEGDKRPCNFSGSSRQAGRQKKNKNHPDLPRFLSRARTSTFPHIGSIRDVDGRRLTVVEGGKKLLSKELSFPKTHQLFPKTLIPQIYLLANSLRLRRLNSVCVDSTLFSPADLGQHIRSPRCFWPLSRTKTDETSERQPLMSHHRNVHTHAFGTLIHICRSQKKKKKLRLDLPCPAFRKV